MALGLLLVVLGHDTLMAANPHASEHAAHERAPVQAPEACGPTQGVQTPSSSDLDLHGTVGAPLLVSLAALAAPDVPRWWSEPSHPPDVRRALLQVYLN